MKACPGCSHWIPDDAAFCPSCGKATAPAPAAAPGPTPPSPSPSGPALPEPKAPAPAPAFDRAKAEARVRVLGVLYMVAGGLTILTEGYALAMLLSGRALKEAEAARGQPPIKGNPDYERVVDLYMDFIREPGLAAIPYFLALGLGAFYLWSGLQLRDLRGRTTAFVTAILLIVLFLCSAQCCGCCFTLPVGVAALIILTRADTVAVMRD